MLKNMPLPVCDVALALKNESSSVVELQQCLNEIEISLLNNQQR